MYRHRLQRGTATTVASVRPLRQCHHSCVVRRTYVQSRCRNVARSVDDSVCFVSRRQFGNQRPTQSSDLSRRFRKQNLKNNTLTHYRSSVFDSTSSLPLTCLSTRHRSFNALRFFTSDSSDNQTGQSASSTTKTAAAAESTTPKKKKKSSSSTSVNSTASALKETPTGRGTSKSYTRTLVTKKHTSADGRVKETTQSAMKVERTVSDGDREVSTSTEFRNVHIKQSKPISAAAVGEDGGSSSSASASAGSVTADGGVFERETTTKEMSKKAERISIKDMKDGREQSEESETSTVAERAELEAVDEHGTVISSKRLSVDDNGGNSDQNQNQNQNNNRVSEHPDKLHTYDRSPYQSGELRVYELKHPMTRSELLIVGNPTDEEMERRKQVLGSPHALIIHPDRLLPTLVKKPESKKSFAGRMWDSFYSVTRNIRNKVIGDEKWEQYSEAVRSTYAQAQENWDTTQNPHLVAVRSLVDKLNIQTETSRAMEILQDEMEDFWVEDFLPEFSENILPIVIRAYFNEDLAYLQRVCVGEAHVFVSNTIQAREQAGLQLSNDILWINEAELVETKLSKEKKPQIIVRAEVQTVDCVYDRKTRDVVQGAPSLVANNVFVMTLETCLDETHLNDVGYPWCIRSLQTAKVKQLI